MRLDDSWRRCLLFGSCADFMLHASQKNGSLEFFDGLGRSGCFQLSNDEAAACVAFIKGKERPEGLGGVVVGACSFHVVRRGAIFSMYREGGDGVRLVLHEARMTSIFVAPEDLGDLVWVLVGEQPSEPGGPA